MEPPYQTPHTLQSKSTTTPSNNKAPTLLNGDIIPSIIFGSALRPDRGLPDFQSAYEIGYRGLDTACSVTLHNEVHDGVCLSHIISSSALDLRDNILLQSKYVAPMPPIAALPYKIEDERRIQVFKSIARSCANLQIEVLDVYFLMRPFRNFADTFAAWRALEEVVQHGGIRYLGLGHTSLEQLQQLYSIAVVKPRFVQSRCRKLDKETAAFWTFCGEHDIVLQLYGVLWEENRAFLSISAVSRLAKCRAIGAEEALYGLLIAAGTRAGLRLCIVDGARKKAHMEANLLATRLAQDIPVNIVDSFVEDLKCI